jgi:hypothetical protein
MTDILDQVGIAYCQGGVMAKNAACRHSVDLWKREIGGWIGRAEPPDVYKRDREGLGTWQRASSSRITAYRLTNRAVPGLV